MTLDFTPKAYWFHSYSTRQFRHYLRVKSYSEYAHNVYEKLYVMRDIDKATPSLGNETAREKIAIGKKSLRIANALRKEASNFPPILCHLMKLDWEYCISSCMAIHEYIEEKSNNEVLLLHLLVII